MLKISSLKIEYETSPIGLDVQEPAFSWAIVSDRKNVMQKSYRLRVFGGDTEWDSGVVESEISQYIPYGGARLKARTPYMVCLEVVDSHNERAFAEGKFETGLYGNFTADWITDGRGKDEDGLPVFVKKFALREKPVRARLYASARGVYFPALNGHRAGDNVLSPGWTDYHKRIEYQTYDVTELVEAGENELSFTLGAGWYRGVIGFWGGHNYEHYGEIGSVIGELYLTYSDGSEECVKTDRSWKWRTGPIRSSEIYDGEKVDFTLKESKLCPVKVLRESKKTLVSQECPPVRVKEERPAEKVIVTPKGEKVLDFGQNLTGFVRAKLRGKRGQIVTLRHGETLDGEGNFYTANLRTAKATDTIILSGGEDIFTPAFTFHGFRYVCVEGLDEVNPADFTALVTYSDIPTTGSFSCSYDKLNRLHSNIVWGQKGNFFDIPMDCPQRDERLGWTGDAQMFFATAGFNMDVALFFRKWLRSMRDEQSVECGVPRVIPHIYRIKSVGTAAWSDCATIVPDGLFRIYGDRRQLREHYPIMRDWVRYIQRQANERGLWQSGFQYGDWLALDGCNRPDLSGGIGGTDIYFIANAFYLRSIELTLKAARALGYEKEEKRLSSLYKRVLKSFRKEYVTEGGRLVSDTQTAAVLALHFNLAEERHRARILKELEENIHRHNDHLTTGFVGTPYLMHVLSENGLHALAGKLLLNEDFPSWLYAVNMGATTVWERWNSVRPDGSLDDNGMNSLNHYSYGSVGQWMHEKLCGIRAVEAGYRESVLAPRPIEDLDFAEGALDTIYGRLSCRWKRRKDGKEGYHVRVCVPANTRATVILPRTGRQIEVGSGEYSFDD